MNRSFRKLMLTLLLVLVFILSFGAMSLFNATDGTIQIPDGNPSDPYDNLTMEEIVVNPLNCSHNFGEWYTAQEPTCTEDGIQRSDCALCDYYEEIIIDSTGHQMGEWYTSVMPSPNSTGEKKRECANCDYFETEVMDTVPSITENGYTYYVVDDLAYITGAPNSYKELIVPDTLGKFTVVSFDGLGSAWDNYITERVILPDSITHIGDYAFMRCFSLSYVKLPANLERIGAFAFNICVNLKTIELPFGLESIGEYAFSYCESLQDFSIPASVTTLGDSAFYGCRSLVNMEIPETVTNIGRVLFAECSSLKSIKLADTITNLYDQTFYGCSGLESIVLPKNLTQIYKMMFANCYSLKEITIYNTTKTIYKDAFTNCDRLRDVFYHGTRNEFERIAYGFGGSCRDFREIAAIHYLHTAEYGKIISTTETCDGGGETTFECECGYIWTEKTNGFGHDFGEYIYNNDKTHSRACQIEGCGYIETKKCSSLDWTIITEPTCTEEGKKLYKCKCGNEFEGAIRSNGHNLEYWSINTTQNYSDKVMEIRNCKWCDYYEDRICETEPIASGECGANGDNVLWKYYSGGTLVIIGEGEMDDYYATSDFAPWYDKKTYIDTVIIGNGVTNVGEFAFYEYTNLKNVYFGETITEIDWGAFDTCTSLENIILPNSLIRLDQNCFSDCTKLQSIILPENLEYISAFVFSGCSKLDEISILSDKLTYIGYDLLNNTAYYNKTTNWVDDILYVDDYLIEAKTTISGNKVVKENTRLMAASAFTGCTSLESIIIPEGVIVILSNTFSGCNGLEKVVLPESLVDIKTRAFYDCTNLSEIYFNNNLEYIGESAFSSCKSLTEISIPESVKQIDSQAFSYCSGIIRFVVDDNNLCYSNDDFGALYSKDKSIFICYPNGKDISYYKVNEYVEVIDSYAFEGSDLITIELPEGVTRINGAAFYQCTKLTNLIVPKSLNYFVKTAYWNCSSLENIHYLGTEEDWNKVEKVGYIIFQEKPIHYSSYHFEVLSTCLDKGHSFGVYCESCGWLTGDVTQANGHKMDIWRFSKWIDSNIIEENKICLNCEYFETRTVESVINKQGEISTETGVLFWSLYDNGLLYISGIGAMPDYKVNKYAPWYPYRDQITSVVVEEGVTSIGDLAFYKCSKISDLQLPESIERIGKYAFNGCDSIVSMYIPSSVKTIDSKAFHSCNGLVEFIVSEDNQYFTSVDGVLFDKNVEELIKFPLAKEVTEYFAPDSIKSIGADSFNGCMYLTKISFYADTIKENAFYGCENLENVTIGGRVRTIEPYAFYNCKNLKELSIYSINLTIGDWAFYKCNNLETIEYKGSQAMWDEFDFGNDNKPLTKANVITGIYTSAVEPSNSVITFRKRVTPPITDEECKHNYETVVTAPTCSSKGFTTYTCSKCGNSYNGDETEALAHSYNAVITKATCEEGGFTAYTCSTCGDGYIADNTEAIGHCDENSDGKCDNCEFDFTDDCNCSCHSNGIKKLLYKLIRFFWRAFRVNNTCKCGVAHY